MQIGDRVRVMVDLHLEGAFKEGEIGFIETIFADKDKVSYFVVNDDKRFWYRADEVERVE